MNRLKRWTREIIFFLLLLIILSLVMDWLRSPQAPAQWPALQLQTINGEEVSLNALSQDKPLLLYFWASWCSVCKFTTPSIHQLVTEGENVMTVALRSGDNQQVARGLAKKGFHSLPVVNDPQGQLSTEWQIGATPTIVMLYKGKMVQNTSGWTSYWGMKLRLWFAGR